MMMRFPAVCFAKVQQQLRETPRCTASRKYNNVLNGTQKMQITIR